MQQRVGEGRLVAKVRRFAEQDSERMAGRQRSERRDEVLDAVARGGDAEPLAELLQHVHAGPAVRRVHHEVQCAFAREHCTQRPQPSLGIREMMQHAGTHDLIEVRVELGRALDRE